MEMVTDLRVPTPNHRLGSQDVAMGYQPKPSGCANKKAAGSNTRNTKCRAFSQCTDAAFAELQKIQIESDRYRYRLKPC